MRICIQSRVGEMTPDAFFFFFNLFKKKKKAMPRVASWTQLAIAGTNRNERPDIFN